VTSALRICHLSTVHPLDDVRIFYKQCKALANQGYEVHLIAKRSKIKISSSLIQLHPLKSHRFRSRLFRMTVLCWEAIVKVWQINPSICHIHDPELIPWSILFFKPMGILIVYDVHEDYQKQTLGKKYIPFVFRKIMASCIFFAEKSSAWFFDKISAATPEIAQRFPRYKTICVQNFPIIKNGA
jgi:hypothetical protein